MLLYLVHLADVLEVDLLDAATRKMRANTVKHQPPPISPTG